MRTRTPGAALLFVTLLFLLPSQGMDARKKGKAEYVILVSMDGFRHDYVIKYSTPTLNEMAKTGVSTAMLPSFPASTFPNHYALATGLVPDHNGLVNNSFWNPDANDFYSMGGPNRDNPAFYLGEPIWNTASRQGILTGVHYWVGSEYAINGKRPAYYRPYDNNLLSYEARTDSTLALLKKPKALRPRLLMLYFDEPDHTGHSFGPDSDETGAQVARVDSMICRLRKGIKEMGLQKKVDLIVLSDHGMAEISPDRVVKPSDYLKEEWYDRMVVGTPTSIFSKNEQCRDSIMAALKGVEHIHVWKKEDIPAELDYGTSNRIGDILVAPDAGWQFRDRPSPGKGAHGYFPSDSQMQTVFRAEGPDFRKGFEAAQFRNVSIYPLICWILGIEPSPNDGDLGEIKDMLRYKTD